MKNKISHHIISLFFLVFLLFFIAACTELDPDNQDGNVVTPVYQGMVVSKELTMIKQSYSIKPLSTGINQDDPYNNFGGETIHTEIQTTYQTDLTPSADYFAEVNETLFITVKIYNPMSYELLSFTLNGIKYQSFQFESGSDSQNLIMRISSGETMGIKEFTIDQIKYVDGTEIKDVPIEGNQTVKVGVGFTQIPLIDVTDMNIGTVSMSMTVLMSDTQKVLTTTSGFVKAVLYDGVDIIQEFDILEGQNQVIFNDLDSDTLYQYAVIAKYDLLNGSHQQINVYQTYAFKTEAFVSISATAEKQSVTFSYELNHEVTGGVITSIVLYKNNTLVEELIDFETLSFSGLNSNSVYEIRVAYTYPTENGTSTVYSTMPFKTLEMILPIVELKHMVIGQEAVSFSLNIEDIDNVGELSRIRLIENQLNIHELQDLTIREFTSLKSNTSYTLELTYQYDLFDGQGTQILLVTQNVTTIAKEIPQVSVKNLNILQQNFTFSLDILDNDLVGDITSIELYKGQQLIQQLEDLSTRIFTNLLTNNNYTMVVVYTYNLNDGIGDVELKVSTPILTLSKQPPITTLRNLIIYQESVSFDLVFNENGLDGALMTRLSLFDGNTLIQDYEQFDITEISGLLSNHLYRLEVGFTYDLSDGNGIQEGLSTFEITTLEKQTPTIEIATLISDYQSITGEVNIIDIDQVGSLTKAVAKRGQIIDVSLSSFETLEFNGLIPDSRYTIELTYSYDLNDGFGIRTLVVSEVIYTAPYITVLSTQVINTERLTEGDTLVIEINVDNPQQMTFSRVMINGEYFNVSPVTTQYFIRVEFPIGEEYKGGTTAFVVEKIEGFNHNQTRAFDISQNNVGYAFVNGDILVDSLQIVDQYNESLDYVMPGEEYYVWIKFDNPTGYAINQIRLSYLGTLSTSQFVQSEDMQSVRVKVISMESNTTIHIELYAFTYAVESELKTKNVDNVRDFIVCVINSTYQMIYTPSDLANMRRGYSYQLANDIDLTDYNWVPKELNYIVLDGNGYAINNLRNVKTYVDTHVYYGLFMNLHSSTIKNLVINDVLVMITMNNSTTQNNYYAYVGALAGYVYYSQIENVSINGEISVNNNTYSYGSNIGGLAGYMENTTVERSYVNMIVSNNVQNTGLIAGYSYRSNVNQVFVEGSLFGREHIGGVFGQSYYANLTNVYAYVSLTGTYYMGGLLGQAGYASIKDSYSYIKNISYSWGYGGLVGYLHDGDVSNSFSIGENIGSLGNMYNSTTSNVYSTIGDGYSTVDIYENIRQAMSQLWNLEVWSFKGEIPVLKWQPTIRIIDVVRGETSLSFKLATTDFDQVGEISSVELYLGNQLVSSLTDFSSLIFTGLRYNTEYRIKVTYTYDYLDGQGSKDIYHLLDVKTLPTTGSPEVTIKDVVVSSTQVSFDLDVKDEQLIGHIDRIELQDLDGNILQTMISFEQYIFDNLSSNSNYRMVVFYVFDLSDSYGEQVLETRYVLRTHPFFELASTNILNTEAVVVGDTIVLELGINNPDELNFVSAVINGITYVVKYYDTERIRIDLTASELLGMGEIELVVESLKALFDSRELTYQLNKDNVSNVFINGEVYVTDIKALDMNGNLMEYIMNGEDYIVEVSFYNPSGYHIPEVIISGYTHSASNSNFSFNEDKTKIYLTLTANLYYDANNLNVSITSFKYTNDHMEEVKSRQVSDYWTFVPRVLSRNIRYIYTTDDLKQMTSGYVYQLANDINMQGVNWVPISYFSGVFDGNNHTISNLSIVKTYEDTGANVGLFNTTSGAIIKNLHMTNINFVITTRSSGTGSYTSYVGAVSGQAYLTVFKNISINANLTLDDKTNSWSSSLGGIVGYTGSSVFDTIYVTGTYESYRRVGSIAGYTDNATLTNIHTNSKVLGSDYTGSFVGFFASSKLFDSISFGSASNYGFIGYSNPQSILRNVISMTQLIDGNYAYMYVNSQQITDVYSPNYSSTGTIISYTQMLNVMKTKWNLDIWSFANENPILKFIPQVYIMDVVAYTENVTFNYSIFDYHQVGEVTKIELRHNGITIQELENLSNLYFGNIRYSSTYDLVITYAYTYDELNGPEIIEFSHQFKTQDKENVPTLTIIDVNPTQESVSFDLLMTDVLEIGSLYSIVLKDAQGLVEELTNLDNRAFNNLLSNHNYIIEAHYVYDFNDGFGPNTLIVTYPFKTIAKAQPFVSSVILTPENDAIRISSYTLVDEDNLLEFYVYRLYNYNGSMLIYESYDLSFNRFEDLFSSREYQFEMIYHYDLNDGLGQRTLIHRENISTIASVIPTVIINASGSQHAINYTVSLNDPDTVGNILSVDLYNSQGQKVGTTNDLSGEFTGLSSYQSYEIRVYFEYSKNDGTNIISSVAKQTVKTSPELSVDSMQILNTEAIIIGDILILRVVTNNPSNIQFTTGIINGLLYNVSAQSDNMIRFDINVGNQFDGGLTTLSLSRLNGFIGNDTFSIPVSTNHDIDVMINGEISILSLETLDMNYQPFDYFTRDSDYILAVRFYNPTGYIIESIRVYQTDYSETTYTSFIYDDVNHIAYIQLHTPYYADLNRIEVKQFTYSNEHLPSRNRISSANTYFSLVYSLVPIEIYTATDLQSMTNRYVYKLMNDIDLSGFNWQPIQNFVGVFDGNGYAINNLSIIKTIEDSATYIGLFGSIDRSVIKNLVMNDVYFITTTKSAANLDYEVYSGSVVGRMGDYSIISGIQVNGYISAYNMTNSNTYIGGLVGSSSYQSLIEESSFSGAVHGKATNSYIYVGGLVGHNYYTSIVKSNFLGSLSLDGNGSNRLGGLIGYDYNSRIDNSFALIDNVISNQGYVGGMIGYSDRTYISDSYIYGFINVSNSSFGGITTYAYNVIISNSYSYVYNNFNQQYLRSVLSLSSSTTSNLFSPISSSNQIVLTHAEMIEAVRILWNHGIWDFDDLDSYGNPTLK